MKIIGLAGPKGVGKNTVARLVAPANRWVHAAFADPIYQAVQFALNIPRETLEDRAAKEEPIGWLGVSPRHLLQTLGTEWGRKLVRDDLWIKLMERRLEKFQQYAVEGVVITDVRFENEAALIREKGGEVWHLRRDGFRWEGGHASEAGIEVKDGDRVVDAGNGKWEDAL